MTLFYRRGCFHLNRRRDGPLGPLLYYPHHTPGRSRRTQTCETPPFILTSHWRSSTIMSQNPKTLFRLIRQQVVDWCEDGTRLAEMENRTLGTRKLRFGTRTTIAQGAFPREMERTPQDDLYICFLVYQLYPQAVGDCQENCWEENRVDAKPAKNTKSGSFVLIFCSLMYEYVCLASYATTLGMFKATRCVGPVFWQVVLPLLAYMVWQGHIPRRQRKTSSGGQKGRFIDILLLDHETIKVDPN